MFHFTGNKVRNAMFLILFGLPLLGISGGGGGGGGGGCSGTALSCGSNGSFSMPSNTSAQNPTVTNCFNGPGYYVGSDVDGDGCEDVNYSVENNKFFSFSVPPGEPCFTYSFTFTPTANLNLQGTVWPPPTSGNGCGCTGLDGTNRDEHGGGVNTFGQAFTLQMNICGGECVTMMTDGYAGSSDGTYTVDVTCPPLAVSIDKLRVDRDGQNISLSWNVLAEANLEKFILEKSYDGFDYNLVGTLPYHSVNSTSFYQQKDVDGARSIVYRLSSLDLDGTINTVALATAVVPELNSTGVIKLKAGYNSQSGVLMIDAYRGEYNLEENVEIGIFDLSGKKVYTYAGKIKPGANRLKVPVVLSSGIHMVRLTSLETRQEATTKMLVPF